MLSSALATPAARRFFAAHAQSSLGTGLALLALPLLALERFGSPLAVSAVLLGDLLPAVALGPLVGALVDRVGRRRCAAVAEALRCVGFLVVTVSGSLPVMVLGALLAGVGTAAFTPAALAGLLRLGGEERRAATLALFGAVDDAGTTLGPALGGALLAVMAPAGLLVVNAATYLVSALIVWRLPPVAVEASPAGPARAASLLADARAGVRAVLAQGPEVRVLLRSSMGVVVCIGVTSVAEVVLARDVLDIGGRGLALMLTVGGLGTVLGSLSAHFTAAGPWRWRQAYLVGLTAMALELVACGLLRSPALVLLAIGLGGFGNGTALVHDRLLLATAVPEALHGRLFALQRMCVAAAFTVSYLGAGALIVGVGVRSTLVAAGTALALVTAMAALRLRRAWPAPQAAHPAPLVDALA